MKRILLLALITAVALGQTTPKALQSDNYTTARKKGGVVLASDHVGGIHYPRQKPVYGSDSSVTDVSIATPLPTLGGLGFGLYIATGGVTGIISVNKFGRNIEIDTGVTADIWDGGQATSGQSLLWVAPTAAAIHNIKSSSASDASAGVGARTVRVYGLPRWTSAEINEDITLNGTSDVATDCTYVIIHRLQVLTKGATSVNVGIITATATSPSATTVTALIRAGQGQTHMAVYGIPSTQTAYVGRFYGNVNKAGGNAGLVDVSLRFNPEPNAELLGFRSAHTFGLGTIGTSALTINYYTPKVFAGPGILKVQVVSGTDNQDISAGFDLILVDN